MTIEFKPNHIIDENKLDRDEAIYFISFLEEEKQRHILSVHMCDANRYVFRNISVLKEAYTSSMLRHLEDITFTQATIDKLIEKFNLKPKDWGL